MWNTQTQEKNWTMHPISNGCYVSMLSLLLKLSLVLLFPCSLVPLFKWNMKLNYEYGIYLETWQQFWFWSKQAYCSDNFGIWCLILPNNYVERKCCKEWVGRNYWIWVPGYCEDVNLTCFLHFHVYFFGVNISDNWSFNFAMDIFINIKFDHLNKFSVVSGHIIIIDEGRKLECIRYYGV